MLCSTNDSRFDYDRAYDTFSRINPQYFDDSVIAYSIKSNACINSGSIVDMFMFLDSHVKQRHVFIPKPAELNITVDENDNLVAKAIFDDQGVVEDFGLYIAEDCKNPTLRDWSEARYKDKISQTEHEFYLDIYDKTNILFAICYVRYSNGFTVWSKITVKKISGQFRNSRPKCKVLYSSKNGSDCFSLAEYKSHTVGGIFFLNEDAFPKVVEKDKGLKGISSVCGLLTYRLNSPRYSPGKDGVLRLDVCPDDDMQLELVMQSAADGVCFTTTVNVIGGVWQSVLLRSKMFKNSGGVSLSDFTSGLIFIIKNMGGYAVNNVMWL